MANQNSITRSREQWRAIPGWDLLYQVSNLGRVRSLPRITRSGLMGGSVLKPANAKNHSRYLRVRLRDSGRAQQIDVHRLVLIAFRGPCPDGMECRHLDGNRHNPRLSNLRWGTYQENREDRIRHGRDNKGERHGNARLTDKKVVYIRGQRRAGRSYADLGRLLRVDPATIRYAATRRTWKHVA